MRWIYGWLVSWWDNSPPRRWSVAELRGWPATLGLRHGPDSYGRQQLGILDNGGNSDPVTPREGRRSSDCKLILSGKKQMTVPEEEGPANYVPAAAVIRSKELTGARTSSGVCGLIRRNAKNLTKTWHIQEYLGNQIVLRNLYTGDAWLSSARVVRCWVKSRNERNPRD